LIISILWQIIYPSGKLLPFSSVEGVNVSGWSKLDAVSLLDERAALAPVNIYFGDAARAYRSPLPPEIGIKISNQERIDNVDYPWYLRLLPGSILWGHLVVGAADSPNYGRDSALLDSYVKKELGDSCSVNPRNANLKVQDNKIIVDPGAPGGTCKIQDVIDQLGSVQVRLNSDNVTRIPINVLPPAVTDESASQLAATIESKIKDGVTMHVGSESANVSRDQLVNWLDFAVVNDAISFSFSLERSGQYLDDTFAAKVAVAPGVSTVSTYDFVETSRVVGANGRALDKSATLANIESYILGTIPAAQVVTAPVQPTVNYVRSYSPTDVGLSALMQNFDQSHNGSFGVSLTELSGKHRRASHNGTASYTTASTYKLFVAYSTLLRVENGSWHWSDQINGGRDLAKCFDDMIVISDNDCATALLLKIGFTPITNEARAIGCASTSFLGSDGIKTTPDDLSMLLAQLQLGQILGQQSSRDILINAMKRNVYRQGIPSGMSGTMVADKVGFLDGLLHDAAIVYDPRGTYVLTIMTDGANWADIAELTRQIQALRIQ